MLLTVVILLIAVMLLALWVIFVPIYLRIDTRLNQYQISQQGTIKFSFHPYEHAAFRFRIFGVTLKQQRLTEEEEKPAKPKRGDQPPKKRSLQAWSYLFQGMYKSLRLCRLNCTMDFDDPVFNACMIPLVRMADRGGINASINFQHHYYLDLLVQIRLNKILWTFIRFSTLK